MTQAGATIPIKAAAAPRRSPLRVVGYLFLAAAAVLPLVGSTFYMRLGIEAMLVGLLALSVDILLGFAGLLSLGQAAFFGGGAYIAALMLLNVTDSFWLAILAVIGVTTLASVALGVVALRTRGVYFALITFGFGEILLKIISHTSAIGGSDGLLGIPAPAVGLGPVTLPLADNTVFYYFVLSLVVVVFLAVGRALATPFGLVLRGLHENDSRVPYLGYNPLGYRLAAFVLAANVAALGGAIYPMLRGFVGPNLFAFDLSVKAVVMALVGGLGTLIGALIGGGAITYLESLISTVTHHHSLAIGALFVLCVLFFPDGLANTIRERIVRNGAARENK